MQMKHLQSFRLEGRGGGGGFVVETQQGRGRAAVEVPAWSLCRRQRPGKQL